ncbi:MAG: voltage-gated potassium channel, partial [Kiritimatiellia bacterium]
DSIADVRAAIGPQLHVLEWVFTILFTIEYLLRLSCVGRPSAYARSFFGIVDLLCFLPTYLSLILPGSQFFLTIRVLRLLRVFRVFKLAKYVKESGALWDALVASRRKIMIFLYTVMAIVVVVGSLMYVIEGEENGFSSIPRSIYWAIVTLTTVGYGDISPKTPFGQSIAALVMVMGYAIIAVPTGIVTSEMTRLNTTKVSTQACRSCSAEGHDPNARFCKICGEAL